MNDSSVKTINRSRPWCYSPICDCGSSKDRRSKLCKECQKKAHAAKRLSGNSTRKHRIRQYFGKQCSCCGAKTEGRSKNCRACKMVNNRPPIDPTVYMIDGSECRKVPLTRDQYSTVDAGRYEEVLSLNFFAKRSENGQCFYGARKTSVEGRRGLQPLSNLILGLPSGVIVDHRNHDTLDNRRKNLRPADRSQNGGNNRTSKANTSGHKGIYPVRGKWRAIITKDREQIHLGYFDKFEEAVQAWQAKAVELFGEFACWAKKQ